MEKKMIFRKPKWTRRFSSAFLDITIAIILSLLFSFIASPFSNFVFNGQETYAKYYDYALTTHLFELNEESGVSRINNLETFDENITLFFNDCTDNKLSEYENFKKEKPELFHYDESLNKYVENDYDSSDVSITGQYYLFYNDVIDYCVNNYLDKYLYTLEGYSDTLVVLNRILYLTILLSSLFGLSMVYILVPMIRKDGKTIGKIAFKIGIISKVNVNCKPTKLQILFRQLVTVLFEFVLSIATIGFVGVPLPLTLLFSMVLLMLSKYNQSFHDFCCSTFLIDEYPNDSPIKESEKYEIIYYNVKEV